MKKNELSLEDRVTRIELFIQRLPKDIMIQGMFGGSLVDLSTIWFEAGQEIRGIKPKNGGQDEKE